MELTPSIRQSLRHRVGIKYTGTPVTVVPGNHPPKLIGEHGGWFTCGGTPIDHPGAYASKGWSNMIYKKSSLAVVVGERWLERHLVVR